MNLTSLSRMTSYLFTGLLMMTALVSTKAEETFPLITSAEVKSSLAENEAAWKAKIEAAGLPRLLYDKAGLAAMRTHLMTTPTSPEVQALLRFSYEIAPSLPRPYVQPEEMVKMKHITPYTAEAELWIRDVGDEITVLTVAATLDPSPVLKKALHDAVIETCHYPTWGKFPGNSNDLACAHAARGVALAWDWFPSLWSSEDRALILQTITSRANQLLSSLYGGAFWAAGYQDNHNHVNCSALAWCGLAFYTDIPQAPEWLAAARLDFQRVAHYFPEDGTSPEGVPYWSYGMGYILQYIEGTRGIIDSGNLYQAPFLKNTVPYRLNASTGGLGGILPWGDAPLKDFNGPQHILNRLAREYQDPSAAWLSHKIPFPATGSRDMVAWMALWQSDAGSMPSLPLDYHHWVGDLVMTRSGWGPGDYTLAIKSGFNNRNHSHLDAGSLALAFGAEWLLTAPGYGKGSSSPDYWDFGDKRWKFFENATESHCTLLIDGQNQRSDRAARGTIDQFFSTPYWSWTRINLTEAYKNITSVRREVLHRRGDYILVFDSVVSKQPAKNPPSSQEAPLSAPSVTVEWLAQFPSEPEHQQDSLLVKGEAGQLRLTMLSPAIPFTPRKPLSPHVNPPLQTIHTYAATSRGKTVDFIALLQPSFSDAALPDLKTSIEEQKPGFSHILLSGKNWTDHIFTKETLESDSIVTEGVRWNAKIAAIRKESEGMTSCLLIDALVLELPGIAIQTITPTKIGLQKTPEGSWVVDADHDIQMSIIAKDLSIHPIKQENGTFRYLLAKNSESLPRSLEWLASLVVFRDKAPMSVHALPEQAPLSASFIIPIAVKNFSRQGFGNAETVEGKLGSQGTSLRNFGNGSPDHFVAWPFEVSEAGQYQLTIRYATKPTDARVSVLVDGAAPAQELINISLPSTGGWSVTEDNWKNWTVPNAQGKPFVFHLSKGKHELRLAKPNESLALDHLEFQGVPHP
jgi:hypothetical protein